MTDKPDVDYKDTVFLPKTDFPMRGGLPKKEPEIIAKWEEMDLYNQIRKNAESDGKPKYVLHDGLHMRTVISIWGTRLIKFLKM